MPRSRKYPEELLDRGVRLALESGRPIAVVARDLGVHPEALRKRVRRRSSKFSLRSLRISSRSCVVSRSARVPPSVCAYARLLQTAAQAATNCSRLAATPSNSS